MGDGKKCENLPRERIRQLDRLLKQRCALQKPGDCSGGYSSLNLEGGALFARSGGRLRWQPRLSGQRLDDASFDAVVNVGSSHCYGRVERFFAEAARILRPGGHFLYTDFRADADMDALETQLASMSVWEPVAREDITAPVADAMQADDERKRALIRRHIPSSFQHLFGEFAGLVGGQVYSGFRNGTLRYMRFAFRRR